MILRATRILGAATLVGVGAVHLQQYFGAGYNVLPTIGPLFLLNGIGAAVVAVGLLMPLERLLGDRLGDPAIGLLALAGVAIAAGSLVALFISESQPLFGFQEYGYDTAIKVAIATESATVVLLLPVAAAKFRRTAARGGEPSSREALESR
jgi:hypothetical protein